MATAVLTNIPTTISLAESTTGWTGDTFSLEPDIKVQGSNSVACVITPNAGNSQEIYYTGFTAADLSAVHLRLWGNISFGGNLQTEANNGWQVFISDGTNTAYWTVAGSDTYAGGWKQFTVYTGDTPTSGTLPTGNSTRVGMKFSTLTKPRNVPANSWFDAWYYGDGYTVTGGTSGDEIDWSHVAALDLIEAYNIVERIDDVYFFSGDITVGSGATTTYFSSGQKVQFKDLPVSSTLYSATFEGSACNVDIAGGSYGAAGTQDYLFDASDTNLNSFDITGVQFNRANSVLFAAGESVTNNVFDNCGQVEPSTSTFTGNIFSNFVGTDGALYWPSDDSNIANLQFINCDYGVEYDDSSDTTPIFNNLQFDDVSGNYDVHDTQSAASDVTIEISNTVSGIANSYLSDNSNTVTFSVSVTVTLTGIVDSSELTIVSRGTAVDSGSDGSTTSGSRDFVTTNSWTVDAYKGHLLKITSGTDVGRYYCYGNSATTLYLDAELTTTASALTWLLYDENDDVIDYHVENTSGNEDWAYTSGAGNEVDIMVNNVLYQDFVLVNYIKPSSSSSLPISQIKDVNYYNP